MSDGLRPAHDALMPLHIELGPEGTIVHAGPTLRRICPEAVQTGARLSDGFELRGRHGALRMEGSRRREGGVMRLVLRSNPRTVFRAQMVETPAVGGALLNLSFGVGIQDAVRRFGLAAADFAPVDAAVEILFLIEANHAVFDEWRALSARLDGARSAAEEAAQTDQLTGALNRRGLATAMNRIPARAPLALMLIDLDYFKQVNDTAGHAAGDAMLRDVSQVLRDETRDGDSVARIGGDEFVVLLPGCADTATLERVANRIRGRLHAFPAAASAPRVTASIGTALHTGGTAMPSIDVLLDQADRALYVSKAEGRDRAMLFAGPDRIQNLSGTPSAKTTAASVAQ